MRLFDDELVASLSPQAAADGGNVRLLVGPLEMAYFFCGDLQQRYRYYYRYYDDDDDDDDIYTLRPQVQQMTAVEWDGIGMPLVFPVR